MSIGMANFTGVPLAEQDGAQYSSAEQRSAAPSGRIVCPLVNMLPCSRMAEERSESDEEDDDEVIDDSDFPWDQLFEIANRTIAAEIAALPSQIKAEVSRVPCLLERWCPDGENLGLYMEFQPGQLSDADGPIFIYIGDHYLFADRNLEQFEVEVRRTYLHELCHHFGLDEHHIAERGLD